MSNNTNPSNASTINTTKPQEVAKETQKNTESANTDQKVTDVKTSQNTPNATQQK